MRGWEEEIAITGLVVIALSALFRMQDPSSLVLAISSGLLGYLRGRSQGGDGVK